MKRLLLPRGTTVYDVADACRTAITEFLALDPHDTRGLSAWFSGPYRRALGFAGSWMGSPGGHASVEHESIPRRVSNAQADLRAAMAEAAKPGAEGLVAMLPSVVEVVAVRDSFGAHGFAPLNQDHGRLASRVLTLLMADYLTRPDSYLTRNGRLPDDPVDCRRRSRGRIALARSA